ncbi:MAG: hypothetical protein V5A81_02855 [Candidatus Bipolaricaulota bacterium]|nr:hypothetical protein [Candidatus Bipolaricaulota bacterium]MBS3792429.1 hypothetical protein [Candidatus Bipolaricaulota bacterium]
MRWRTPVFVSLLLVLLLPFLVMGAPKFALEAPRSVTLNPKDARILVQEISVTEVKEPIRIKELTVKNNGTASASELVDIQVRYRKESGDWNSITLENLTGINSGITFTLPGHGLTLNPEESGHFQFRVSAADPEMVPVSKYGRSVSLKLGTMLHYVYQERDGEAVDSVSSDWVVDSDPDGIVRAGFEEFYSLSLEGRSLLPGTTSTIGRYVFRDVDANRAGVEVDEIVVENKSVKEDVLVFGEDISQLQLRLRIEEDGEVSEKTVTELIAAPTSEVSISTTEDGWWDGRCSNDCRLELEIAGKLESNGPTPGLELKTGVTLVTREDNGMDGYPFNQEAVVPDASAQKLVELGMEKIKDISEWESGVINQGETYKQRLILSDDDPDAQDFIVKSIKLQNQGSLRSSQVKDVSLYRVHSKGEMTELGSDLGISGSWQSLNSRRAGRIPDDGRGVFEIHYRVVSDAEEGATFNPLVQFRGSEGASNRVLSPELKDTDELTIYPRGAERVEVNRNYGGSPSVPSGNAILAQRLDIMDRDENKLNLHTNPIVIQNMGDATSSDFTKLELYDSRGNKLAERTDLSGLSSAGITLDNLDGKTIITDNQAGNWRSFFIYLTPRSYYNQKSVNLRTTLYQTEGTRDIVRTVKGPSFAIGRGETVSESRAERTVTTREEEGEELGEIEITPRVGIAIVGGVIVLGIILSSQVF